MGISPSTEAESPNEHFFGLVNFGNTCYVNSVLQALYFCKPFREKIIEYKLGYAQRTAHLGNKENSNSLNNNNNTVDANNSAGHSNGTLLNSSNGSLGLTNGANGSMQNGNGGGGGGTNNTSSSNSPNGTAAGTANVSILKQEHLLNCLAELFYSISNMKKKKGIVQPKKFIARLRKDNDAFDNLFQQDAHEFLNYLLNTCADILKEEMRELKKLELDYQYLGNNHHNQQQQQQQQQFDHYNSLSSHSSASSTLSNKLSGSATGGGGSTRHNRLLSGSSAKQQQQQQQQIANGGTLNGIKSTTGRTGSSSSTSTTPRSFNGNNINNNTTNNGNNNSSPMGGGKEEEKLTWIHELFQGILVNETKCLNCETSSSKEENFLDLSVDVEQNTSLSHCLQEFSSMEMLCGECKYYCETCRSKQEAEKRMRIKKLPKVLALHLKRFKFVGMLNKFKKLTHRVVFPFELRLFNTTEDCENSDQIYDLVSFVVHCGIGLNRGHYISVVKSHGFWFLFDDEQVEKIEASNFEEFYGLTQDTNKKSETSYILFYEARST